MESSATVTTTDRIEKQVTLRAPVARVWRAIADSAEFSRWFGVEFLGEFAPGKRMTAVFPRPINEAALMDRQRALGVEPSKIRQPGPDLVFCTIERIEPERYFSFRWIPFGIEDGLDPAAEPTTLVEFRLEPVPEGTHLTIIESGFDRVPEHRRRRAFVMNDGGWTAQSQNIRRYVEEAA